MEKITRIVWLISVTTLLCGCPSLVKKTQNTDENTSQPSIEPPANAPSTIEERVITPNIEAATAPAITPVAIPAKPIIKPVAKPVPPIPPKYIGEKKLVVLGAIERATIEPGKLTLEARIDTGAATTSMHAENIVRFERDGKGWVKFNVANGDEQITFEQPIIRRVKIKRHNSESQRRYVVALWITIGEIKEEIEVTLTNRSNFKYPILIGRNFLTDTAVVDVSRHHVVD